MDPFSITLGVVTLTTLASKTGIELKKPHSGAAEATKNVNAMLADLKALRTVLNLIEDVFEDLDSRAPLTGHVGAHWSALMTILNDGCDSLDKLELLLVAINKDVKYLDTIRRTIRLKEANGQIVMYRQEIQAYKDALQLSFQSVICELLTSFWYLVLTLASFQQCTVTQNATEILDRSRDLHQDLSRLSANLEIKLTVLEMIPKDRKITDNASIRHLQQCAKTAATVVASASTVADDDFVDEFVEAFDIISEFGWFDKESAPSNLSLDWVPSLHEGHALSSDDPARSQDHKASATDHLAALQSIPTPSPPHDVSPTSRYAQQISKSSIALVPPAISSLDSSQTVESESRHSLLGDETAKNAHIRKRRSFSLSKLLSPRIKTKPSSRQKELLPPLSPLCKDDLSISATGQVTTKWTFVGDGACRKTCFLISTSMGIYSEAYLPTIFENYAADAEVDGVNFKCALWDTAGQVDYDRVRPLSYPQTDIICTCFSIDSWDSLENVEELGYPEIEQYKRKTDPIFLLGFKEDLRQDPKTIDDLGKRGQAPVTRLQGEAIAKKIGASRYFECSAIRHQGTKEILETVLGILQENGQGRQPDPIRHQRRNDHCHGYWGQILSSNPAWYGRKSRNQSLQAMPFPALDLPRC